MRLDTVWLLGLLGAVAASGPTGVPCSQGPPVLDIGPWIQGAAPEACPELLEALRLACRDWGFFQVVNHGVSSAALCDLERAARDFFARPTVDKLRVKRQQDNARGFADDELTKQKRDRKEIFDVGPPETESGGRRTQDGWNQWPDPDIEEACSKYFAEAERLSAVLLRALCASLGWAQGALDDAFGLDGASETHTSFLRLNYYPASETGLGVSRHTDAGALTVLKQDAVAGLEVYSGSKEDAGDGAWVPVQPISGALTINVGDMLQVWSNGRLKAAEHRVRRSRRGRERFSMPFFYNPSYATTALPRDVAPGEAPAFRPVNWGHFRALRFQGDFADTGQESQIEDFRAG